MSKLDRQFLEDRALRNAARKNVLADVELLKSGWSKRGLTKRVAGRIGGGAQDVFQRASETAEDNRGVLSALIGAIVLWFASGALLDVFDDDEAEPNETGSDETEFDADVKADESEAAPSDDATVNFQTESPVPGDEDE